MNYVVCLSDTGSSCHVTVMGSLIVLVNKRADWNVPVSYIKYMFLCMLWYVSALNKTLFIYYYLLCHFAVHSGFSTKKTPSKVNTILKVVIFKHSVILFRKQTHFSQLFCLQVRSVTPRQLHDRKSRCLRGWRHS